MYKWQFSPVDSSLPFVLTDCPASYSAAQTQFEVRSRLLPQNKSNYCYKCCSTHWSRDTLNKSSYKQKELKEIIFLPCLVLREARTKHQ